MAAVAASVLVAVAVCGFPVRSVTVAPASRARSTPAAVSQGLLPSMMAASASPAATKARSMVAAPAGPAATAC